MVRINFDSSNPYLPIIMMLANLEYQYIFEVLDVSVNKYLIKVFSAKCLFSRIQAVIER